MSDEKEKKLLAEVEAQAAKGYTLHETPLSKMALCTWARLRSASLGKPLGAEKMEENPAVLEDRERRKRGGI
jgi:hypothetical protein